MSSSATTASKSQKSRPLAPDFGSRWWIVRAHLPKYRTYIIIGLLSVLVAGAFSVARPYVLKIALDDLEQGRLKNYGISLGLTFIGLSIVSGAFLFLNRRTIIWMSRKLEYDLRAEMFERLLRQPMSFYHERRIGDIMARLTNDIEGVRQMVGPGMMYTANTVATTLFAVGVMLYMAPTLTLYTLLPMPLLSYGVAKVGGLAHKRYVAIQAQFSLLTAVAQENLSGMRVIKAYAQEEPEIASFREVGQEYLRRNMSLARLQGLFQPLLFSMGGIVTLVALYYGGKEVIAGNITRGTVVTFFVYIAMLIWPVVAMGWVISLYQRGIASLDRINELFRTTAEYGSPISFDSAENEKPDEEQEITRKMRGKIEFRHLTFSYRSDSHNSPTLGSPEQNGARPALADVSFVLEPGESLGVIGPVASGKSTLAALVARLYAPPAGAIFVDGEDIVDWNLRDLRAQIGFVPQESFLFSDTLRENFRFGAPDVSSEKIEEAARVAGIDGDIAGFAKGYDTIIGERGITLSGGQKQRVALARATLIDPRIIILDDATSAVDTATEAHITESLRTALRGRTAIIISHRVSAVKNCDKIMYLDTGRVTDMGGHRELMTKGGPYAELFRLQQIEEELSHS